MGITTRLGGSGLIYIGAGLSRPIHGDIAQLGKHLLCKQRVVGSSPIVSTSPASKSQG